MEHNFQYQKIKGNIAETIIKGLFIDSGYNVFDYGMEKILPSILEKMKGLGDAIASEIRNMPDFVVQHAATGRLDYVEVKYRKDGCFKLAKPEVFPYKNAWFIIVSKTDIQCISYADLLVEKELTSQSNRTLENCANFDLKPEMVTKYRQYCKNFYKGVF
ncbi:hypothetical protein [Gaoshiqia sediminis]|uniref:Uncharacterized protein n=1 Tax=Gaoshiqia sediminis TaxID=2986998 RepID=A0AA42CA56_9BACT|nr:hypothetical protein [Gaoshiqia sediminis]MCW0483317.1 hypothetical protein [Gaoshiqia sediminis]